MRGRAISASIMVASCAALIAGCAAPLPAELSGDVSAEASEEAALARAQGWPDKRQAQSTAVLDDLVDAAEPGCSAAVALHGEVVWAGAKGLANLETSEPLTIDTRFDIASVSKQFTATAILMLQREGLLSLDDPVGLYVDGLPGWGQTVTLEQLVHHTSRIPDYWKKLEADGIEFTDAASHADIVRAIASVSRLEPETGYLYSNANYVLLAEVVHRVSGQTLPEFLDSRIFEPLGLDMELSPGLQAPDVALSYDDDGERVVSGWTPYGPSEIFTTPAELARWADQYRDSTVIAADFAAGAVDTVLPGETSVGRLYGAGIAIESDGTLRHDGRYGGHITTFQVYPDRETAVVVMCNGHLANRFGIAEELRSIWGRVLGE